MKTGCYKNKELITLMILSSLLAYFYVFDGFVPGDSIRYALGLQRVAQGGISEITNTFNGEMSFGYYVLMASLMGIIGDSISLSALMNSVSAAVSVILQFFLFLLYDSLCQDKKQSLIACLMVMLAPGIWMLSYYGHPIIMSVTLFVSSLYLFNKIAQGGFCFKSSKYLWLLFVLLSTSALAVRTDIVLCYGSYFGVLYFRRSFSINNFSKTVGALLIVLCILLALRYLVLGYIINPTGGRIVKQIPLRIGSELSLIVRYIIVNASQWAVSANVLVVLFALVGFFHVGLTSKWGVLLFSWVAPWCIFLPFRVMPLGRIAVPTIPMLSLVAVLYFGSLFRKRKKFGLVLLLILTQVFAAALYYPLIKMFPFKIEVGSRVLSTFPLGFPPVDHHYRQRAIWGREKIAKVIVKEKDQDVLIMGSGRELTVYEYYIQKFRDINSINRVMIDDISFKRYITPENVFLIFDFNYNWQMKDPFHRIINGSKIGFGKIHLMPYWKKYPLDRETFFLTKESIEKILYWEAKHMSRQGKRIHY